MAKMTRQEALTIAMEWGLVAMKPLAIDANIVKTMGNASPMMIRRAEKYAKFVEAYGIIEIMARQKELF